MENFDSTTLRDDGFSHLTCLVRDTACVGVIVQIAMSWQEPAAVRPCHLRLIGDANSISIRYYRSNFLSHPPQWIGLWFLMRLAS